MFEHVLATSHGDRVFAVIVFVLVLVVFLVEDHRWNNDEEQVERTSADRLEG